MEHYDPGFICNGSDNAYEIPIFFILHIYTYFYVPYLCYVFLYLSIWYLFLNYVFFYNRGRYSYEAQPSICKWNCEKLGEALTPLLPRFKWQTELDKFMPDYERCYHEKMHKKVNMFLFPFPFLFPFLFRFLFLFVSLFLFCSNTCYSWVW